MVYALLDIGGSTTRVAVSLDGKTVSTVETFATPTDPKAAVTKISATINSLHSGVIAMLAAGVRGILNEDHTGIEHDRVLDKWEDFDLVAALQTALNIDTIILENDTALAGLGEAVYGAGQGVDILAYHTVSTGVGGVKIESGHIDRASIGFEPGHQILDIDRTVLGPDVSPTLENLISGTALEARMGSKPTAIDQSDVVWEELAGYLGQGLRNTILYWSPEMIVLGGAMMIGDPRIPIEAVRKATVDALDGVMECPFITTAKLGDEAGLYGALARCKTAIDT